MRYFINIFSIVSIIAATILIAGWLSNRQQHENNLLRDNVMLRYKTALYIYINNRPEYLFLNIDKIDSIYYSLDSTYKSIENSK